MKLIATDMDGTLLNELGEVSPENVQAIQKALDKGIQVIVATGRSYDGASKIIHEAGLSLPIICLNGAMTYTENKELIKEIPMERGIVQKIQKLCERENLYYEIFSQNKSYSVGREEFKQVMIDIAKTTNPLIPKEELNERAQPRLQEEEVEITEDFDELLANQDLHFYNLLAFSLDKDILTKIAKEFQEEPSLAITASGDINIEFNHIDARKGFAVKEFRSEEHTSDSSHVSISYAVFCLQKKKMKTIIRSLR